MRATVANQYLTHPFRTVSEDEFCELRRHRVLRSSPQGAENRGRDVLSPHHAPPLGSSRQAGLLGFANVYLRTVELGERERVVLVVGLYLLQQQLYGHMLAEVH